MPQKLMGIAKVYDSRMLLSETSPVRHGPEAPTCCWIPGEVLRLAHQPLALSHHTDIIILAKIRIVPVLSLKDSA